MDIRLRELCEADISGMMNWMTDREIIQYYSFDPASVSEEKCSAFIKSAKVKMEEGTEVNFAITDESNQYLGTISLKRIDPSTRSAEYAIALTRNAQGHGVATMATKQLLAYAFQTLQLNRVFLNVLSENTRATRFYEKVGFSFEGEFREHRNIRGELRSIKWYGILAREFKED